MRDQFGSDDPREELTELAFFPGSLRLDYSSAVRADTAKQNFSVLPRYWYVDATFICGRCSQEFTFSATEQRVWYEEFGFWVFLIPKHCLKCRRTLRDLKGPRREYDRLVEQALGTDDLELKKSVVQLIDQLYEIGGDLPQRINENRKRLAREIERLEKGAA